ncbi:MAG: histidine--tRNA ligase [Candidatus Parvarchaeota archaeon]|nr:histidine--tRNA ligase [Candidatus Jingweiarchaeum tengchongense]
MEFGLPRGVRDFLPSEMIRREYVINVIKNIFECYGFEPLDTPAFENFEILAAKCGPEVKEQIYYFKDKSGRELGLRFDLTVPLARVIAMNPNFIKPFKRYCISKVWRYEEPQKGRWREFYQADIDIVGSESMLADAECVACVIDVFKKLGFDDFYVRINNRKLLDALLIDLKVPKEKVVDVFRVVDKTEKVGIDGVRNELMKMGLKEKSVNEIISIIKINGDIGVLKKIEAKNELIKEAMDELVQFTRFMEMFGMKDYIKIDLSLTRGLDYYTSIVFEVTYKKYNKSIAGGGRYNNLIKIYRGQEIPATGISIGVERVIEIMEEEKMFNLPKTTTQIFVAPVSNDVMDKALKIAQILRKTGKKVETELMNRNLKQQLDYCNKKGIEKVLIVGKKDLENGEVTLRNLKDGKETKVKIEKICEIL